MATHFHGTDREEAVLNTWIRYNRAMDSAEQYLRSGLDEHGMTFAQFAVMEMLYHLGSQNQRCIGEKTLKSPGNVVTVVDNLERQGWVARKKHPRDRRAYLVELTTNGQEKIVLVFQNHLQRLLDIFGILTMEEIDQMGKLSKKLGLNIPASTANQIALTQQNQNKQQQKEKTIT